MKVEFSNDVLSVEDGNYNAVIDSIHEYGDGDKVLIKLNIEKENVTLINFTNIDALGRYPWNNVFKALNTDNTDDLIGKKVEIRVENNEKGDTCYCNIKKVTLV
ncbi:MAG: hypothetical protein K2J39_03980 [Ruminococcus sp.]|nr:hypothetical protein [Ruminococcus sp.]